MKGTEYWADHMLIRGKLVVRRITLGGIEVHKRIDALKLNDSKVQANLRKTIREAEFERTWAQFKTMLELRLLVSETENSETGLRKTISR